MYMENVSCRRKACKKHKFKTVPVIRHVRAKAAFELRYFEAT